MHKTQWLIKGSKKFVLMGLTHGLAALRRCLSVDLTAAPTAAPSI